VTRDDLDHGTEGEIWWVAAGRYVQILRKDSKCDLFSHIPMKLARDLGRQLDADAFVAHRSHRCQRRSSPSRNSLQGANEACNEAVRGRE